MKAYIDAKIPKRSQVAIVIFEFSDCLLFQANLGNIKGVILAPPLLPILSRTRWNISKKAIRKSGRGAHRSYTYVLHYFDVPKSRGIFSHVKFHMWEVSSYVKFHVRLRKWIFTVKCHKCYFTWHDGRSYTWNLWCDFSHVYLHMLEVTCDILTCKIAQVEFYMWKNCMRTTWILRFTFGFGTSHVNNMRNTGKFYVKINLRCYDGRTIVRGRLYPLPNVMDGENIKSPAYT